MEEDLSRIEADDCNESIRVMPQGVSSIFTAFLVGFSCIIGAFGGYGFGQGHPDPNASISKIQADAQAKQSAFILESQKLDQALRMDVAKRCVDGGRVPEFVGGNVYCKPIPK